MASDGEWYPPETHPHRRVTSRPVPDADERRLQANNGIWYPLDAQPNGTAGPSGLSSLPVPDAEEGSWQVGNGQSYPPVADHPAASPQEDLDPRSEGVWSQKPTLDEVHDFYDGRGPVPAHHHVNGGGWVANTATVSRTAFVGPASAVFERSKVLGRATVADEAQIRGQSEVSGNAHISGNAVVDGEATVTDEAEISDHAFIGGRASVSHDGHVGGYTQLIDGEVTEREPQLKEEPDPQLVSGDNGHLVGPTPDLGPVSAVPIAASPQPLRPCPGCGKDCTPDASFCAACGYPLAPREVAPTPDPLVPTTSADPLPVAAAFPPVRAVRKRRRNALSVWSIVLVIVLGSIGALIAIPMGFVARRQIRQSHGTQKGAGLALAAIIIGFVLIGITLAAAGLLLTRSPNAGPSLSGLTASVRAQIAGDGPDSLKVPGVTSVVCNPPGSWQTGESFTCYAHGSTGSTIGKYVGTVAPNSPSGQYEWNATWYSAG